MQLSELFLKSFTKAVPRLQELSAQMLKKHSLLVNYPLELMQTSTNRHCIYSPGKIRKGNDLVLLAMSECIFSTGFTGATLKQQLQIASTMEELSRQYETMNKDFLQRTKIYVQLLANSQQLKKGKMNLKNYTQYVLGLEDKGLVKSNINSRFLMDLYQSWQISNKITYKYLKKQLFKRVEEQQYVKACINGRYVIRSAGDSPFLFAAPFLDKLDHSFTPNCEFQMLYMPHRREPFVRIKSIKDIEQGQKPTINYGKLNNYELLIRYGFSLKNNPYSIFMLPLNFENILQIFNKNIQWKQEQFLKNNLKLRNYVKIQANAEIQATDLKMLRILICDSQSPSQNVINESNFDKLINSFIVQHAKQMRKNIKINNLKVSIDEEIKNLEDEQIRILQNFIKKHEN